MYPEVLVNTGAASCTPLSRPIYSYSNLGHRHLLPPEDLTAWKPAPPQCILKRVIVARSLPLSQEYSPVWVLFPSKQLTLQFYWTTMYFLYIPLQGFLFSHLPHISLFCQPLSVSPSLSNLGVISPRKPLLTLSTLATRTWGTFSMAPVLPTVTHHTFLWPLADFTLHTSSLRKGTMLSVILLVRFKNWQMLGTHEIFIELFAFNQPKVFGIFNIQDGSLVRTLHEK